MKISQEQLKKIIKEELAKQLQEDDISEQQVDEIFGKLGQGIKKFFGGKSATQDQSDAAARAAAAQVTQQQPVATQPETPSPQTAQQSTSQQQTTQVTQPKLNHKQPAWVVTRQQSGTQEYKKASNELGNIIASHLAKAQIPQQEIIGIMASFYNILGSGKWNQLTLKEQEEFDSQKLKAAFQKFGSKFNSEKQKADNEKTISNPTIDSSSSNIKTAEITNFIDRLPIKSEVIKQQLVNAIKEWARTRGKDFSRDMVPRYTAPLSRDVDAAPEAAQPTDEKPEISGLSIDKRIEQIRQIIADPNTNSEVRKALAKKLQSLIQQQKAGTNFANMEESKKPVSYNKIYNKWQKIIKG